jgi:hypothetical protein
MSPRVEEPEVQHSVYAEFRIAAEDGAHATAILMQLIAAMPQEEAYALGMRAAVIANIDRGPDQPEERAERWFGPN